MYRNTRKLWNEFCLSSSLLLRSVATRYQGANVRKFKCHPRSITAFNFDNFENLHNSFLLPEYFIDYFCANWFIMSDCDIRLVFTFPPNDRTLQHKICVHLWNNFSCISTLPAILSYFVNVANYIYFKIVNERLYFYKWL